jgi:signal peptidase I
MTTMRLAVTRTMRVTGNLLLAVVIVGSAAFVVPGLLGYDRYVITGGSMSGTFEVGSVAFERPVPTGDLRVGDVITYLPPPDSGVPDLVTHRILSIQHKDGHAVYRTKGDANAGADPWSFELHRPTQASVVFTVPQVGRVFMALADRRTRMFVVGVPAGLIALYSLAGAVGALRPRDPGSRPDVPPSHAPAAQPA